MSRSIIVDILGSSAGFTASADEATNKMSKFGNVLTGIGQGIGQSVFGAMQTGISDVTGFIEGSIQAAKDEQLAIAGLTTSLKDNVPGWNGDTSAIEAFLTSMENTSGFAKDELTTSLELLVGATHDVAKAESDQAIATNLARLKNIDLASATQLVINVEAHRFRGLVQLGIVTTKQTTVQQALNDLTNVAAGQDQTYMSTAAGKTAELTNKMHDLQVELGNNLLPIEVAVTQAQIALIDSISKAPNVINTMKASLGATSDTMANAQQNTSNLNDIIKVFSGGLFNIDPQVAQVTADINSLGTDTQSAAKDIGVASVGMSGDMLQAMKDMDSSVGGFVDSLDSGIGATLASMGSFPDRLEAAYKSGIEASASALGSDTKTLIADMLDPISGKGREALDKQIIDGTGKIGEAVAKGLLSTDPVIRAAAQKVHDDAMNDLLLNESIIMNATIKDRGKDNASVQIVTSTAKSARASGGPVSAGVAYTVGEAGSETFVPSTNGSIIPHGAGSTMINLGPIHINGITDPSALARAIVLPLKRELQLQHVSLKGPRPPRMPRDGRGVPRSCHPLRAPAPGQLPGMGLTWGIP